MLSFLNRWCATDGVQPMVCNRWCVTDGVDFCLAKPMLTYIFKLWTL